ncbi:hypothetical protein C2845_PM17G09630 [Panicum miliaceum]|uniref:Uncharacterized protein n=1 Tax=Panicum miliaceum TaxID=4540 RepID=A0A3L6Q4X4_PANMI|nr:hypothetical protein C2845_PM17G09630 [Panicum miliaceum]
MVSFGEAALGLPSTGSYPSKTTGHLASPGKSKEKSSENSTNHVEPGEEVSSPLKKKQAPTQRNAEGGSSVKKCDIDGNSGQQQWKRKPATDGEVYIGGRMITTRHQETVLPLCHQVMWALCWTGCRT